MNKNKLARTNEMIDMNMVVVMVGILIIVVIITFLILFIYAKNNSQAALQDSYPLSLDEETPLDPVSEEPYTILDPGLSHEESIIDSLRSENSAAFGISESRPNHSTADDVLYSSDFAAKKENIEVFSYADKKHTEKITPTNTGTVSQSKVKTVKKPKNIKYAVQVASLSDREKLAKLADEYEKKGFSVYTEPKVVSGKSFYRLRIGPFEQKELAEHYLALAKKIDSGKMSYLTEIY